MILLAANFMLSESELNTESYEPVGLIVIGFTTFYLKLPKSLFPTIQFLLSVLRGTKHCIHNYHRLKLIVILYWMCLLLPRRSNSVSASVENGGGK